MQFDSSTYLPRVLVSDFQTSSVQLPRGDASSDLVASPSDSWKPGILEVALYGLSLSVDADTIGLGNLADRDVRKGLLPYVIIEYGNYQVSIEAVNGRPSKSESVAWTSRNQQWFRFNASTPSDLTVHLIVKKHNASGTAQLIPTGFVKLNLSVESFPSSPQSVDL
ncbi:hypothetical protein HD806DRAFT_537015 [Xylariaceae sp. AK1471]|nr:hypothetical protein HD806DRAFT_537015 [Xylariaceae sp. AK1471]